eukprot:GHUV01030589.1.p1 GENE.GHUV01030589.1~~GHUV01030589.1.p1  ORF type:complete len:121 (-),score=5.17 GHUV01030589.1:394-756(-)
MSLNLLCDLPQHVDLLNTCITLGHPSHDVIQPSGAFTARGALTTRLVLVEVGQPGVVRRCTVHKTQVLVVCSSEQSLHTTSPGMQVVQVYWHHSSCTERIAVKQVQGSSWKWSNMQQHTV